MQLIKVSAKTGYIWFRQGIWLFKKSPLVFISTFLTYLLMMWFVSLAPQVGAVLSLALIPGATAGFMAACRDTMAGKPVFPTIVLDGFRSYGTTAMLRLFELGGFYILALAFVFSSAALADGGVLLRMIFTTHHNTVSSAVANNSLAFSMLIALGCYIPVAMLFWFAPVLTAWHNIPPVKAMFFSIVSCWRNRSAFMVYGALWFITATAVSLGLSILMRALGIDNYALAILMSASITVTAMLYCSFYATYCGCFDLRIKACDPA